jgi:hypothetical protein
VARERARAARGRWRHSPTLFAREVLGIEPWTRQAEILQAVDAHPAVAVRSGHKVGKSTSAAIIAWWWMATRERPFVILTSAGQTQVKEILWAELRRLRDQLYRPERDRVYLGGVFHDDPRTGVIVPGLGKILGFTTNEKERMAGFSGAELLYIPDESSGIDDEIFEAIEGNRAGGARIVMFSNPTQTSGYFYDAFHDKKEFFHGIHISSEESPNVAANRMVVPGLALRSWIEEREKAWGRDSALFDVRVAGNFPRQGSNSVIGLALVDAAGKLWAHAPDDGDLELGVDCAEFGDDESMVTPRRGKKLYPAVPFRGLDPVQLAGSVLQVAKDLVRKDESGKPIERVRVKVDVIGVGSGCAATLAAMELDWLEVLRVNVSEEPTVEETLAGEPANLRAQLWLGFRDWLKEGGAIPPDPKLEGELVAPTYRFDARGRILIEKKEDLRKRLKRSPDRADSACLAVYNASGGWLLST